MRVVSPSPLVTVSTLVLAGALALVGLSVPATATDVETPSTSPGKLVLVLDASGSMAEAAGGGATRISAAKQALDQVIDTLPDDQQVALRVFGSEVEFRDQPGACEDSQRIVDLGTDNREDLRKAARSYEPFGETPTGYALQQAGDDLGDSGQRSILLVSDGEPTCDPDPCEVAEDLAADGVDVRIDVVGLSVSGEARTTLECIADAGNGTYYDADDADDIIDSVTTSAARAARPFDFTGTPVEGTPDPAVAPEIGQGQWVDTMPTDDGDLYYRLPRTDSGSTLHVGVTVRSKPEATVAAARLSILPADGGVSCFSGATVGAVLGMRTPLLFAGGSTGSRPGPDQACNTDDTLLVKVEHGTGNTSALGGEPLELAVYEEPPLADPATPPDGVRPLEDGAWEPMEPAADATEVLPGTSLASAPVIGDGTWSADIQPGEAQVFAVPVDWGQDVQFQLDTRITPGAARDAAVGSRLDLTPVGPVRDDSAVGFYATEPDDWTTTAFGNLAAGSDFRTGARTQPVAYANRTQTGTIAGASVAGVRYVQVAYNTRGDDANLPYTLTIRTNGTAGEGSPEYADADRLVAPAADSRLVDATPAPTADDDPARSGGETPTETGDAGLPVALVVGLGVLAVAAVGGVVTLVRRRA